MPVVLAGERHPLKQRHRETFQCAALEVNSLCRCWAILPHNVHFVYRGNARK